MASPSAAPTWKDALIRRAGQARLCRRHAGVGRGRDADEHGAEPERHHHQAGEHVGHSRSRATGMRDSQYMPPAAMQRARRRSAAGCRSARSAPSRRPRRRRRSERDRDVGRAGRERGEAEHVLHVQGDEEEHRVEPGDRDAPASRWLRASPLIRKIDSGTSGLRCRELVDARTRRAAPRAPASSPIVRPRPIRCRAPRPG